MSYDIKLMVKEFSNLYYKENLTQNEISKKIKISKYKVNRILKKVVSNGIVEINIIDSTVSVLRLEADLGKNLTLRELSL